MNEPVRLVALVTGAVTLTVNVIGLVVDWPAELIAGINLALGAWVAVAGEVVRSFVTPNGNVALTVEQLDELQPPGGDHA